MIDATPPPPPTVRSSVVTSGDGKLLRLGFSGYDALSGIQKNFYVQFGKGTWFPTGSELHVPLLGNETYDISVRVFDNANNFSDTRRRIIAR